MTERHKCAPTAFRVVAIDPDHLAKIRAAGVDDHGNPLRVTVEEEPGTPLRCCLREARVGERIALLAFQPFTTGGPYAEVGPVFVHADECPGYTGTGYPQGFAHRRQVLRGYDRTGDLLDAVLVDGAEEATRVIGELLTRAAFVHSRNMLAGCFMFAVHPAD